MKTPTPLGILLDVAKALQEQIGFKLTHHEKSTNDMLGLYDKDRPETQGSAVFVNREGTAIIGYSRKKLSGEMSFRLLTKEIESMPLEKLSKIRASEDFLYPEDIKKYLNERVSQISALMEKKDKPSLTISNSEDIINPNNA